MRLPLLVWPISTLVHDPWPAQSSLGVGPNECGGALQSRAGLQHTTEYRVAVSALQPAKVYLIQGRPSYRIEASRLCAQKDVKPSIRNHAIFENSTVIGGQYGSEDRGL